MTKSLKELPKTSRGGSQRGCGKRTEGLILSGENEKLRSKSWVCPNVLIQSPPQGAADSALGPPLQGFKESWTNPSISKGSIKHQQGSLCQASLPCTAWHRQGGAGGLENTDCHWLCQFSHTTRLLRDSPAVMAGQD